MTQDMRVIEIQLHTNRQFVERAEDAATVVVSLLFFEDGLAEDVREKLHRVANALDELLGLLDCDYARWRDQQIAADAAMTTE